MNHAARAQLDQLRQHLRSAALATVGGFRPPQDPLASWFGRGAGLPHENLPEFEGAPMFPLLQIRVAELPYVPGQLCDVALLVLFHNQSRHPFDLPHGEGWPIREYASLDGLVALPQMAQRIKPFPIRWRSVDAIRAGWHTRDPISSLLMLPRCFYIAVVSSGIFICAREQGALDSARRFPVRERLGRPDRQP